MIGYLLFLTAYSVLLVSQLSAKTFHWLEAVVMTYIVVFLIKEIDQFRISSYKFNSFNILDILGIVTAFVAWSFRWMDASRYVFSLDFMFYMFRFLEFFYMYKFLGPIIVMIRQKVKTYILFLLILLFFLVAYSVASESLLYPETQLNSETLYYVFRKGFWAMIGDYLLEELEATEDQCTTDPALYINHTELRCPSANARYFVPVMLGAYAIFIQILMFSLLIALFNYDVAQNVSERDEIWSFQKFKLTSQLPCHLTDKDKSTNNGNVQEHGTSLD